MIRRDDGAGGRLDFERLRARASGWNAVGGGAPSHALPSFLGRVATDNASIRLNDFCRVVPTTVLGDEREGSAGLLAPAASDSASVLVLLIGTFVPSQGDYVVCRFVDHRWVAETSGGARPAPGQGGVALPSCFCRVPATLQMHSDYPECNYRMFQSCSLTYGPPPAELQAIGYTGAAFVSTSPFDDPISGASFYYYFWCRYNQFFLTRIFPHFPDGTPDGSGFRDGILYSWIVGGYGNQCDPFQLLRGTPFPGSDASCAVQITG